MLMQLMNTTTDKTSYADKINQQFNKSKSQYVNLNVRLGNEINKSSWLEQILENCIEDFKERNPQFKTWNDLELPEARYTTLDKITIDITLQRLLMVMWVIQILDKFNALQVMPIQVYRDPACPDKFVCWDGQHTAIVLFIIATMVLGLDISKCKIPIVISSSKKKEEMRQVFIENNGAGKKQLDQIDYYQQKVFGVRTDKSTRQDWLISEKKQQFLESARMFATHEKFGDQDEAGAFPRMNELCDENYKLVITKYFTQYFVAVCLSTRPVQPKESWMLYEYFRLCDADDSISVDPKYIRSVAKALQATGHGDFDSRGFFTRAKISWQNYYRQHHSYFGNLQGIRYPERSIGLTFLIEQIKKAGVKVPYYDSMWPVPQQDLF